MSKASKVFNELPYDTRLILSVVDTEMRINQIRIDQDKAKSAYQKFMRETNEQITNCERSLKSDYLMLERKGLV